MSEYAVVTLNNYTWLFIIYIITIYIIVYNHKNNFCWYSHVFSHVKLYFELNETG